MEFITIFDHKLYSFKDENTDETGVSYESEWDKVTSKWENFSYVRKFFEQNGNLLSSPYFKEFRITKEQARMQVVSEAADIKNVLRKACKSNQKGKTLDDFFKPLDNNKTLHSNVSLTKGKSTLRKKPRLLRVYAVRIAANVYVLTGGAIKLVLEMKSQNDTWTEKLKMDRVRSFIQNTGTVDEDGFYELIYEQDGE